MTDSEKSDVLEGVGTRRILAGTGVSSGIVIGRALRVGSTTIAVSEHELAPRDIEAEIQRFNEALDRSREQLAALRQRVLEVTGEENAAIFDVHLMLVGDPSVISEVHDEIRRTRSNAHLAFHRVIKNHSERLAQVGDSYIRERLVDVQDVAARVVRNLHGYQQVDLSHLSEPCIIVAEELSPSDTASMDRENVLGFVTAVGSRTSHTAIMARALGIPAVVGVRDAGHVIANGEPLILDGAHGRVIVHPTHTEIQECRKRIQQQEKWLETVRAEISLPAETVDGFHVRLAANIELPEEASGLANDYGVGVGLFRTEFLFVKNASLGNEEAQFEAYRTVAEAIRPYSVIFRTLDIGGDKFLSQEGMPMEMNPFLGQRAIRFCLQQLDVFRSQLRAILRASAYGKVRIMFPMITTYEELSRALEILEEVKAGLAAKGIPHNPHLDVGIMVEVPSAALLAHKLAPLVDFFSLGTNDLVQYSLAVDRSNPDISYLYQPTHPSIIRLMKNVVDAAYEHGRWVGICGEMASEPILVPLILGLGIQELSMSPVSIPLVKRLVRHVRMYEAEELVERALECATADEVLEHCHGFIQRVLPEVLQE